MFNISLKVPLVGSFEQLGPSKRFLNISQRDSQTSQEILKHLFEGLDISLKDSFEKLRDGGWQGQVQVDSGHTRYQAEGKSQSDNDKTVAEQSKKAHTTTMSTTSTEMTSKRVKEVVVTSFDHLLL